MTSTPRTPSARLPLLACGLAVLQAASPGLYALSGAPDLGSAEIGQSRITPADYAFTIWGAICALSLVYTVWSVTGGRRGDPLVRRLSAPLSAVFAGFALWLVFAGLSWAWVTVAVFAGMLAALLRALHLALADRARIRAYGRFGRSVLWGLLGLYTGWTSVAVWINLSTALADAGAPLDGTAGTAWQLAVLAAATATVVVLVVRTRALPPYAAAALWATTAAAVGATRQDAPALAWAAGAATACAAAAAVLTGVRQRTRTRAGTRARARARAANG